MQWLKTKWLLGYSQIFGGEPVYLYDVNKYQVLIKLARRRWNPFDNDPPLIVTIKKKVWSLDNNGTFGPMILNGRFDTPTKDKWMYVRKTVRVEHVLKHGDL